MTFYFTAQARATDYFSFVAWFLVAFGAVFEMPVGDHRRGAHGHRRDKFLRKHWRYAIVINAIIAMVATPSQDAFSFIAMFIPLEILYECSLLIARVMERRRSSAADARRPTTTKDPPQLPPDARPRDTGGCGRRHRTASAREPPQQKVDR